MQSRLDEPLPLWRIFPVVFAALYASHFTLLRLPYYWDEAGYYIPAAWDFFRTGSLIPLSLIHIFICGAVKATTHIFRNRRGSLSRRCFCGAATIGIRRPWPGRSNLELSLIHI